jgi:hypothetical protein
MRTELRRPRMSAFIFIAGVLCLLTPTCLAVLTNRDDPAEGSVEFLRNLTLEKLYLLRAMVISGVCLMTAAMVVP